MLRSVLGLLRRALCLRFLAFLLLVHYMHLIPSVGLTLFLCWLIFKAPWEAGLLRFGSWLLAGLGFKTLRSSAPKSTPLPKKVQPFLPLYGQLDY